VRLHDHRPSVFGDVHIVHRSLAEFDMSKLSPETAVAGLSCEWPVMIGAITGGCSNSARINAAFARAAARHGIAMAVGSQRAALEPDVDRSSYEVVRQHCPDGIVLANLPAQCSAGQARDAVAMIGADALQLHLNGLQELLMPEGDRQFSSVVRSVESVIAAVDVPVMVKEVGFGMSHRTATDLESLGVAAIDIGGQGGTSFASIEAHRASPEAPRDSYKEWGLPTAVSLAEARAAVTKMDVVAGGGIRDGHEILKALVMGACAASVCGEFLAALDRGGEEALDELIDAMKRELLVGMAALGVVTVRQLAEVEYVVTGDTALWLMQRGVRLGRNANAPAS